MKPRHILGLPLTAAILCALVQASVVESRRARIHHVPNVSDTTQSQLPASKAAVDELSKCAIVLKTVEAGHGFEDLRPLKDLVGGARIVSVGDPAPGTREFFQVKQRLLEFLVSEMGFRVLAAEVNWPESRAVNEYVLHGTGDPKAALAGLHAPSWNTEEALGLVQWMRAWNADPKHAEKLQFVGFDMQYTRQAYLSMHEYLQKVDEESAERMGFVLAAFRQVDDKGRPRYASLEPEMKGAAHAAIQDTLALLEDSKEVYVKKSSLAEWALAKHSAVILSQAEEMLGAESRAASAAAREHALADDIAWIVAQEPPGTRIVVWAHNAHVRDEQTETQRRMGSYLREKFGKDVVILGGAFEQGSGLALESSPGRKGTPGSPEVRFGPAPEASVEAALARTELPRAVFTWACLPKDGAAAKWMNAPELVRESGTVFGAEAGEIGGSGGAAGSGAMSGTVRVTPARAYDALIFLAQTTSARPLPRIEPTDK